MDPGRNRKGMEMVQPIVKCNPRNAFEGDELYFMIKDQTDEKGRVWPRGTLFLHDALGMAYDGPRETIKQTLIIGARRATFTHKL